MLTNRTTLTMFLIEQRRRFPDSTGDFNAVLLDVALACRAVSRLVAQGALGDHLGASGITNVQGETQQKLDIRAHHAFIQATEFGGQLAGGVSEEADEVVGVGEAFPVGKYLLTFDPLDGSSNIDVNVSVGSVFSLWRSPRPGERAVDEDFQQAGHEQVAAGYALYGPSTMLVLTVGTGVHGFTLDPLLGEFFLTHPDMTVPPTCAEFAINSSNSRFWEPPVARYVEECLAGRTGSRDHDFNMRWVASMVADAHRILTRGGVFLYPRDTKDPAKAGRLRLLYEAAPIAFLMEQAGGRASTGRQRLLDVTASEIHERIPLIFGSAEEVERIERYHAEFDAQVGSDPDDRDHPPLYGSRSLFRACG